MTNIKIIGYGEADDTDFNIPQQMISDNGTQDIIQPSEFSEAIKHLNEDELDKNNFSSIDTRTRLHETEISSIIAVDTLVALGFLPAKSTMITRSKKRLAVSRDGLGRKESVQLVSGIQDKKTNAMSDWVKGLGK